MEERLVKDYLTESVKKELPPLVKRELKVARTKDKIISIFGPRRAGKTYYFYQLIKETKGKSLYLNFEDPRLFNLGFREIRELVRMFIELTGYEPDAIFFDEVQVIENWELALRSLLDLNKYEIYVTGSSSKLLSKEIATSLRGRTFSYILLPFSFREFLKMKKFHVENILTRDKESKIRHLLREYLEFGGFPEVIKSENKEKILKEYYDMILFRDFIERHRIKSLELARFLASYLFQNFSKEISVNRVASSLSQRIKFGKNTLYDYFDKIEDTLMVFFVNRLSKKVRLREAWPKKTYVCDMGLTKVMRFSEDIGKLMENCVFLELKRMENEHPLLEIYYYRQTWGEVDFVLKEGLKIRQLIQVTYASGLDEVEKRELRALIKASDELKCKDLLVITWDYESEEKVKGKKIKFLPLWKWLLRTK